MTRRLASLVCTLLLLLAVPVTTAAQETQDTTALPESLHPARASIGEAWTKLDAAAVSAHFADNAVIEFGGDVMSGRQAVDGWLYQVVASMTALRTASAPTFVIGTDEVRERSGYTVVTTSGEEQSGRSETLWKRQEDGSWKVARLTVL